MASGCGRMRGFNHQSATLHDSGGSPIFKWINWYNTSRLHSSLEHAAPLEWEQRFQQAS